MQMADWKNLSGRAQMILMRRSNYREVFNSAAGRAVLRDLYRFCGVSAEVLDPDHPARTAQNDGMRRVALHIAVILGQSDEEILRLGKPQSYAEIKDAE